MPCTFFSFHIVFTFWQEGSQNGIPPLTAWNVGENRKHGGKFKGNWKRRFFWGKASNLCLRFLIFALLCAIYVPTRMSVWIAGKPRREISWGTRQPSPYTFTPPPFLHFSCFSPISLNLGPFPLPLLPSQKCLLLPWMLVLFILDFIRFIWMQSSGIQGKINAIAQLGG